MTTIENEDKLASAKSQGQAQFESIREMVSELRGVEAAFENTESDALIDAQDAARERIQEDALSVEVQSGWVAPGAWDAGLGRDRVKPEEYCILLCTGGPACRIIGTLDEYCQPETARMEVQDWFQPWTEYRPVLLGTDAGETAEDVMLTYARVFWYGE